MTNITQDKKKLVVDILSLRNSENNSFPNRFSFDLNSLFSKGVSCEEMDMILREFQSNGHLICEGLYNNKIITINSSFYELKKSNEEKMSIEKEKIKVFIAYGKDENAKLKIENFIRKIDFEPVILEDKSFLHKSLFDKLVHHSNVDYCIVIYSPDDIASLNSSNEIELRARQNVVFEHGYFLGKLGIPRVCIIITDTLTNPSDINGIGYIDFKLNDWQNRIIREMKSAGLPVDANKILE